MTMSPAVHVALRLLVAGFCGLTALYTLVASSTFAYLQFLRPRVFPWVGTVADWHAAAAWAAWAALAAAASVHVRAGGGRRFAARVLVTAGGACVAWNAWSPLLPTLADDARSLWVAQAAAVPVLWLSALDVALAVSIVRAAGLDEDVGDLDGAPRDGRRLLACLLTALTLTVVSALVAWLRVAAAFEPDLPFSLAPVLVGRSATAHAAAFVALFLAIALVARCPRPRRLTLRWGLWAAAFTAASAFIFDRTIANALSIPGVFRPSLSLLAGASVVSTWMVVQWHRADPQRLDRDPLALFLAQPSPPSRTRVLPGLVVVGVLVAAVPQAAAAADWDDLLLRLGTLVVWCACLAWAYRVVPPAIGVGDGWLAGLCLAPLVGMAALAPSVPRADAAGDHPDRTRVVTRYLVYDPSFQVARMLTDRAAPVSQGFNRYLRAHTGLTDVAVAPRSIDFVSPLGAAEDPLHVFLFVIDSLRADYLAPYNPKVWFTPAIGAFAAESTVFTNAFTRYGGTGLSVPAIWAGSALPHKQYVLPFAPMNGLEKLLAANRYRRYVGLDSIMTRLLERSPDLEELDRGVSVMDYELCRTLGELEGKLRARPREPGTAEPLFAYSLPQDIHMSRLSRWAVPEGDFAGFFAPYAGRVQALDRCFGRFLGTLRALGLYDRSLIVLTSDHGEMLGENGQFGHSYHLRPEVVRVPLIIHFPVAALQRGRIDPDAVAFSTDITPTIYRALGYHPDATGHLMGRSLLSDDEAIGRRRRGEYVLSASYGAVYAVVGENGRRLYVADAVKGEDHLFERMPGGAWRERGVSPDLRARQQYAVRRHVDEVAATFDLPRRDP